MTEYNKAKALANTTPINNEDILLESSHDKSNQLQEANNMISSLRKELEVSLSTLSDLQQCKLDLEKLQTENNGLNSRLQKLEKENTNLKENILKLQTENTQLTEEATRIKPSNTPNTSAPLPATPSPLIPHPTTTKSNDLPDQVEIRAGSRTIIVKRFKNLY